MYRKTILNNGLKVVTHNMKDRDSAALGIWFNVGGRYEEDRIKGAAHFLEHIVFKGSKKYRREAIKQTIEGVGGMLNAFTTEEQTCFYAKIPSVYLEQSFDVLADISFFPKIRPGDLAKEKTVIMEEIKMYHDLPQYMVMDLIEGLVWPKHPLGKNLAGTIKSVGSITKRDLNAFHKLFYGPANAGIVACGKMDHDHLVRLAKRKLGKCKLAKPRKFVPAVNEQHKPQVKFHRKRIEQMHLAVGALGYDREHEERYAQSLLSVILGGNMSSRLFVQVREKHGLAYSISSYAKSLADTGMFLVRAGVDNHRCSQAIELILKELEKIRKRSIGDAEFTRARDYLIGQLLISLEDTMEHMIWVGESIMARERIRTTKEVINELKKITPADVRRAAKKILAPDRLNLALVGPLSEAQKKTITAQVGLDA